MLEHPTSSKSRRMRAKDNKYQVGKNLIIWDDQQERLSLTNGVTSELKWWLAGFVDGEGSFCLNIKRKPTAKLGFTIDPGFYVYQHKHKKVVLETFKHVFKTGSIHNKTSPSTVLTYQIAGIQNCYDKVLPFFRKYQLITKREVFEYFGEAVSLLQKKHHFSESGKWEIVDIAYKMNLLGKGRKWTKKELIERILRD